MVRVPVAFTLSLGLILAACGSPETPASADKGPEAIAPAAADQTPMMPGDAPPQEEAGDDPASATSSCAETLGEAAAVRLAERCTRVSPASHPPCNPANPCALIQDEIDRSCGQYGPGETKPAECAV